MEHPEFNPSMPPGYEYAVTMVRWTGHAYLVTYTVWNKSGYREERCACILHDHVKWDQIMWAESGHVKEYRAQKVDRVRLKPLRRRHW